MIHSIHIKHYANHPPVEGREFAANNRISPDPAG